MKKMLSILLSMILVFLLALTPLSANAAEEIISISDCSGVILQGKTYSISTADEFMMFELLNSGCKGATVILTDDIVINSGDFLLNDEQEIFYNGSPVSDVSDLVIIDPIETFKGTFDGQEHTISGAYIISDNAAGLFKKCEDATVKNINIENSLIIGSNNIGSVCGIGYNSTLQNCICDAIVSGDTAVGGIAGSYTGYLNSCFFKGSVIGKSAVGGVAGSVVDGTMYYSGNSGNVYGEDYCGGFIGKFDDGFIDTCFNTGNIYGSKGSRPGGFIGLIATYRQATFSYVPSSIINSCYTCGEIVAEEYGYFCYRSYGDFSLFYGCYFKGSSEDNADYDGSLQEGYDRYCDRITSSGGIHVVPSFYMFAVNEERLKKNNQNPLYFGCESFVEDAGLENKGYMIPRSLHKAHVWGDYTYNNDATCIDDGTKTAVCTANGCRVTNTVNDAEYPATGHSFGEYILDESGLTETAKCQNVGCEQTDTREHVHRWSGHHKNNDAKLFANETQTRYCLDCGKTQTTRIPYSSLFIVFIKRIFSRLFG